MGKINLLLLFPKSGHNNNEPEHQACLCTASKCPSPAHAAPGERDEEAARLEGEKAQNAMFRSLMNYLHRVETILYFVAASRNADLHLHLQAGETLSKLFFAMDRLKYKRLWPRYIADMHSLKTDHPDTSRELEEDNISVTKSTIPFVSIGAGHACEQLDRLTKDHAGLIGI